jgi:hypothetical protein
LKAKIIKHDKKKYDKDKIGNILLKHVLAVYNLAQKKRGTHAGSAYGICSKPACPSASFVITSVF